MNATFHHEEHLLNPVHVGICGLGTVGSQTFNMLINNASDIERRIGRAVRVTHVGARRDYPHLDTSGVRVSRDILEVARDPDLHVLVELIGGYDVARELVLTAIEHGKHVVTANKALIAVHGQEIFAAAKAKGVTVRYEAAVAGGIPIIKALREGLAANRINCVAGIINGTGNFILSEMREKGRDFADVLQEAQALGYAEADPTFDVEGIDAAHKLTILSSIAYGIPLQFEQCFTEGISAITSEDVEYAEQLGYRIKHLGVSRRSEHGIDLRVHPTMIPADKPIANVNGVLNAVMVAGDAVGDTLYVGAGAGAGPTGSAVMADVLDIARSVDASATTQVPALAFDTLSDESVLPIGDVHCANYLRVPVADETGVLAKVTGQLSAHDINIEAIIQKEPKQGERLAQIILLTHSVQERVMAKAVEGIEGLAETQGRVSRIRVEYFN